MKSWMDRLRDHLGSAERIELAAGSVGALAVRVGGTAAVFLQQVLLARLLGVEAFGDYVYVISWIGLLSLGATLGLDTTALRFVAEYAALGRWRSVEAFFWRSTAIVAAVSASLALGVVVVAGALDQLPRPLVLAFFAAAPLLPALSLLLLASGVLRGLKRTVLSLLPQWLLRPVLVTAGTVVVWLASRDSLSAPTVILVDTALTLVLVGWLLYVLGLERATRGEDDEGGKLASGARDWLRTSLPVAVLTAIRMSMNRVDIILLGVFAGTTVAGVYAVAAQMSILITFGLVAVNMIAAPLFAELTAKGEREELQRVLTLGTRGSFGFSLVVGTVLIAGGPFLLRLFGEEFVVGFVPMVILVVSQVLSAAAGSASYLLTMTGHERLAAWQTTGAGVLNLALNLWAIPRYGMVGAAAASGLGNLVWTGLLAVSVRRRLGLRATAFGF